jgi:hypothetical protein
VDKQRRIGLELLYAAFLDAEFQIKVFDLIKTDEELLTGRPSIKSETVQNNSRVCRFWWWT